MKMESTGIIKASVELMKKVGAIGKNNTADMGKKGKYKFRGIDDVYNAVQSGLIECGIVCTPNYSDPVREERETKYGGALIYTTVAGEFTFYCTEDGSHLTVRTVGEAMDTGDKSTNKAMSAAYKYAMFQFLCIPVDGGSVDSEVDTYEVAPKAQAKLTAGERRQIAGNLQDYGLDAEAIKAFTAWVAEQKGCDPHDRKIGVALLKKEDCSQWLKDFNAAMVLEAE
jgi:hypothetical protein